MSGTDQYLAGLKVLIVEDEPFIALDLAFAVEEAGGIPLGPAPSVAQALKLIEGCSHRRCRPAGRKNRPGACRASP